MICESCKKKDATVHIVKMAGGEKSEINLCENCAREKNEISLGFEPQFSLHKLFSALIGQKLLSSREAAAASRLQCPECGLSLAQFAQVGRLGCGSCLKAFEEKIKPLVSRIHAGPSHSGKIPARQRGRLLRRREVEALKEELSEKVRLEAFEEAAELRDRIKTVEAELEAAAQEGERKS